MQTEHEAAFLDVDKDEMREKLKQAGATLERPEFLQRRVVLDVPADKEARYQWARVRDEGDKITMAWKAKDGEGIDGQKEIQIVIDDFDNAVSLLEKIGCESKSYQETKREIWKFAETEVVIDSWPFLEPLVEIEGSSEEIVRAAAEKLGFDWKNAHFDSAGKFYRMKYGEHATPTKIPRLIFDMQNPFV